MLLRTPETHKSLFLFWDLGFGPREVCRWIRVAIFMQMNILGCHNLNSGLNMHPNSCKIQVAVGLCDGCQGVDCGTCAVRGGGRSRDEYILLF